MKDRYLFRGKRIDNGDWVEGSLLCWSNGKRSIAVEDNVFGELDKYPVIPETVGQFTGLKDKNGMNGFEGDLIKCIYKGEALYEIICRNDCGYTFWMSIISRDGKIFKDRGDRYMCISDNCEIIGNIHDHPELLKEAKNEGS